MADGEARVRAFMARVGERLSDGELTRALPDLTVRVGVDGVGSWLLTVRAGAGCAALEPPAGARTPVDCECSSTMSALERVATGRLKPVLAVLSGQIRLSGDRRAFAHLKDVLGGAARAALAAERAAGAASPALRVDVVGVVVMADGIERYATYELAVREAGHAWQLRVRWSDVRALEDTLARAARRARAAADDAALGDEADEEGAPPLPRLARWADVRRSLHPAFLERRRKRLQRWTAALLGALPGASVLRSTGPAPLLRFFAPPDGAVRAAPRARGDGDGVGEPAAAVDGAADSADAAIELAELEGEIARVQALPVEWARDGAAARAQLHERLREVERQSGVGRSGAAARARASRALGGAVSRAWSNPIGAALASVHALLALAWVLFALHRATAAAHARGDALALPADGATLSPDVRLLAWLAAAALGALASAPGAAACTGVLVRAHIPPLLAAARARARGAHTSPPPTSAGGAPARRARSRDDGDAREARAPGDGEPGAGDVRRCAWPEPDACVAPTARAHATLAPAHAPPDPLVLSPPPALPARLLLPGALAAARASPVSAVALCVALLLARRALRRALARLYRIYTTALITIGSYTLARRALRAIGASAATEARAYSALDGVIAPFACDQFCALRSLWVKFGQYIGSRSDIVPPRWARALEALQDDLPADAPSYVRETIRAQLGQHVDELFSHFEWEPLASASVAQVHRATLRDGARPVALKLQHEGVDALMRSDFVAALRIARFVVRRNGDFEPMLTVLQAWAREVERELDFGHEASHLRAIGANMRAAGVRACVPQPVHGLVAQRVFCMEYVAGFKLTDAELLLLHGVDREALMRRVTLAYACQLFTFGRYNADPHPGNLLVRVDTSGERGEAEPALLDFGWTVELSEARRLAYCKLVSATAEMDAVAMASATRELGFATNQQERPERDIAFWAYYLRDTGSRETQRAEMDAFLAERKAERRADVAAGQSTRRVVRVPDDFMFFLRTIGLLRGLATALDARVPYLELLCMYARRSLLRHQLNLPPVGPALTPQPAL
ncbi:hypothetical protein KFE25_014324 [Diacronema lutheri]|uniref:PX domain-containing protein n=1 Tax=Diacronema lutheri TaxID=2081491 RepID=A0A8J5X377_DIALT|nr:hypothetical protein KFE25_014324 [Diacronema lutheri]